MRRVSHTCCLLLAALMLSHAALGARPAEGAHRRLVQAVGGSTATVPAGAAPPPEAATDATDETGDDTSTNEEDDATESEFGMVDGESTPAFNPVNSTNSSVTGGCSIAVTINYACAAEDPTVYVYHLLTQDQAAGYCVNAATKKGYYCLKTFSSADITAGNVTLNVAEPGMWVYATSAEYDWPSGDSDVWMDLDGGESCSALGAAANDACTELVEVDMGDECPSAWTQSLTCPDFGAAAAPAAAPAV